MEATEEINKPSEQCDYCDMKHTDCIGGVTYVCDDKRCIEQGAAYAYPLTKKES